MSSICLSIFLSDVHGRRCNNTDIIAVCCIKMLCNQIQLFCGYECLCPINSAVWKKYKMKGVQKSLYVKLVILSIFFSASTSSFLLLFTWGRSRTSLFFMTHEDTIPRSGLLVLYSAPVSNGISKYFNKTVIIFQRVQPCDILKN